MIMLLCLNHKKDYPNSCTLRFSLPISTPFLQINFVLGSRCKYWIFLSRERYSNDILYSISSSVKKSKSIYILSPFVVLSIYRWILELLHIFRK